MAPPPKKTQYSDSRAARLALLDQLANRVVELRSSETWSRFLATQARFHRYSPRNVMLISMQRPEATNVAGYRAWAELDRHVLKGEQGLSILAPMVARDPTSDQHLITGFRWVSVFDISQTEGEPLPTPVTLLDDADPGHLEDRLCAVAHSLNLRVLEADLPDGVNGELRWSDNTIAIRGSNAPLQRAKTIAHELGHALLHRSERDRSRAEIEAESVAFVVLGALGADTAPYSAGYVASWLGEDGDLAAAITRSCEAIQRASAQIISRVSATQDLLDHRIPFATAQFAHRAPSTPSGRGPRTDIPPRH